MSAQSKLEQEVCLLAGLSRQELVSRWHRIYRCPPPRGVKRGLLERAIAWHTQAKHFGGLSPAIKRQLREAVSNRNSKGMETADQAIGRSRSAASSLRLVPGTRLIREWHGKSHSVDVMVEGFLFEGQTYASLSAIAREITGARWSGPRFFGL